MVERGGLENRCPLTRTKGSNPLLSAKQKPDRYGWVFFFTADESLLSEGCKNENQRAKRAGLLICNSPKTGSTKLIPYSPQNKSPTDKGWVIFFLADENSPLENLIKKTSVLTKQSLFIYSILFFRFPFNNLYLSS